MVAGPKTIDTNVLSAKHHFKTIDTNGCFLTLNLLAIPFLFAILFVESGPASYSLINSALYSPHFSHPKPKCKINCDLRKTINGNGLTLKNHWKNSAPKKVPISGLGPDRDQCPNMVPKKARFASQVPKLFDWS